MERRITTQEIRLADASGTVRAKLYIGPEGSPVVDAFDATGMMVSRTDLCATTSGGPCAFTPPSGNGKENIFEYQDRIEEQVRKAGPGPVISGHKLYLDFRENETEASARYLNEVITVSSEIVDVQIREYGDIYVGLKGISNFNTEVVCYFTQRQREMVSQLRPGMKIRLKGKCTEFVNNRVKLWGCLPAG
ncbi:MAG: OB-fold protein [Desulfovibrio sp.]|uniref:OB-fold protein n=1 Tax=Desulfovibrio sp. 7SRBS1 TaxID=3378064 RepID=UPI003B40C3EE